MTKLKTLKDIFVVKEDIVECFVCGNTAVKVAEIQAGQEKIKQEAIKWVKELEIEETTFEGAMIRTHTNIRFKKFFNITEDDLKVTRDLK